MDGWADGDGERAVVMAVSAAANGGFGEREGESGLGGLVSEGVNLNKGEEGSCFEFTSNLPSEKSGGKTLRVTKMHRVTNLLYC